jgi:hypothetical protein
LLSPPADNDAAFTPMRAIMVGPGTLTLLRIRAQLCYSWNQLEPFVPPEDRVRANIIEEARNHLGLKPDDYDVDAIEKIGDFLDAEAEKLISPPDVASAFKRLA